MNIPKFFVLCRRTWFYETDENNNIINDDYIQPYYHDYIVSIFPEKQNFIDYINQLTNNSLIWLEANKKISKDFVVNLDNLRISQLKTILDNSQTKYQYYFLADSEKEFIKKSKYKNNKEINLFVDDFVIKYTNIFDEFCTETVRQFILNELVRTNFKYFYNLKLRKDIFGNYDFLG